MTIRSLMVGSMALALGLSGSAVIAGAPVAPEIKRICAGEPVPPGWVKIDDEIDPNGRCPKDTRYNLSVIQRYQDLPAQTRLEICRVTVVPSPWYRADGRWDGAKCGHPTVKGEDNIMVIVRAH